MGNSLNTHRGKHRSGGAQFLPSRYAFDLYCFFFKSTVGTKIIADPEKYFQELISEKLLILLRERPPLELIIVSSNFRASLLVGQITESV